MQICYFAKYMISSEKITADIFLAVMQDYLDFNFNVKPSKKIFSVSLLCLRQNIIKEVFDKDKYLPIYYIY